MQPPMPLRLCLLLLFAVFLQTCGAAAMGQDLAAGDSIIVKGTIKEVSSREPTGKLVGEILVEVDSKSRYSFLVRKDTQIIQGHTKRGKWADLKVEQRVTITYNGIVSPVRPPQAGADRIVIEIQPESDAQR